MADMGAILIWFSFCIFSAHIEGAKFALEGQPDYSVRIATIGKKELFAVLNPEDTALSWATALTDCQSLNLTIASIETPAEDEAVTGFLLKRARSGASVYFGWIGGSDYFSEGHWYWLGSNKPLEYTNWAYTHPTETPLSNCMYATPAGKWQSMYCDIPYGLAICQSTMEETG